MGNSTLNYRIKGITNYSARYNMGKYRAGDFLKLVPEFDNPYDSHALAVYDADNNKLGFVPKESNQYVYNKIRSNRYFCIIISVYDSYSTPSIEFQVVYETNGYNEDISSSRFETLFKQYDEKINHNYVKETIVKQIQTNPSKEPEVDPVIKAANSFFGIPYETEKIYVEDDDQVYIGFLTKCALNKAVKNKEYITVKEAYIMNRVFGSELFSSLLPNDGVPSGYNKNETFIGAPIPGDDNDSYDENYVDRMYDEVEPVIRRTLKNIPIFFENFFGKVYICMMLNPIVFEYGAANKFESVLNIYNEIYEYIKYQI